MNDTAKFIIFICFLALGYVIYDSINVSVSNNTKMKEPSKNNIVNADTLNHYIKSIKDLETDKEKKQKIEEKKKREIEVLATTHVNYSIPSYSILKVNLNNRIGFNISEVV